MNLLYFFLQVLMRAGKRDIARKLYKRVLLNFLEFEFIFFLNQVNLHKFIYDMLVRLLPIMILKYVRRGKQKVSIPHYMNFSKRRHLSLK